MTRLAVYLVDEVSDGAGSLVRRQTLLLQVMGDGRLITDNGRTYHVRPFAVQPGQAQIRNGRLELPNTQQRPGIPILKGKIDNYSRAASSVARPGGLSMTCAPKERSRRMLALGQAKVRHGVYGQVPPVPGMTSKVRQRTDRSGPQYQVGQ